MCFVKYATCQTSFEYIRFSNIDQLKSIQNFPSKATIYKTSSVSKASINVLESITIQLDQDEFWEFDLNQISLIQKQSKITIIEKDRSLDYSKPLQLKQYSGYLKNDPSTKIKLSQNNTGIEALIQFRNKTLYLENLNKYIPLEQGLIVYDLKDQKNEHLNKCGQHNDIISKGFTPENTTKSSNVCLEIELSLALDFEYISKHNHNIETAIQESLTALQMASLDYEDRFSNDINFSVKEIVVSNCPDCDIWSPSNDVEILLDDFTRWASSGGFSEEHDIGQLWSGKDLHKELDFSFVGFAHSLGACTENRYHVLEDILLLNWQRRVLTSHEIGHNLGCNHDGGGSQTVMSPTLTNTDAWSANSISNINQFIEDNNCLSECQNPVCFEPSHLEIISFERDYIHLNWIRNSNEVVLLKIINLDDNDTIVDTTLYSNSFISHAIFPYCADYEITLTNECINATPISLLYKSSYEYEVIIDNVSRTKCLPGSNIATYDLTIELVHQFEIGSEIIVEVGQYTLTGALGPSPFMFTLEGLESTSRLETDIQIFQLIDGIKSCPVTASFYTPNHTCDLYILEDFNTCALPKDWTKFSNNNKYFPYPFDWKFENHERKIENYSKADNVNSSLTINGTCMAYFDDDINSNIDFTGTNVLLSPIYDITQFTNNELSFEYIFHSFEDAKSSNESVFICQVWNGSSWINIVQETQNTCPWSNVWAEQCVTKFSIDLDPYVNENFQVKFLYTDGNSGQWTGMIAIDQFELTGTNPILFGCTDPSSINYNPDADIDDLSCYSCQNQIQDGAETGVDCGGPDCDACIIPCSESKLEIQHFVANQVYSNIDTIIVANKIDVTGIILKPGSSILFNPGFEIITGSSVEVEITPCVE